VASKPNQGLALKTGNVAQDLAVKLQILLGAFSLDLYQKKCWFSGTSLSRWHQIKNIKKIN